MKLQELATILHATAVERATGNEEILYPAAIEDGTEGAISFIGNPHYEHYLLTTKSTAVIVSEYLQIPGEMNGSAPAIIRVPNPHEAFGKVLELFRPQKAMLGPGIHPSAVIDATALIDPSARIGAHVSVGDHVVVGPGARVLPGVYLGSHTSIGSDTTIHPNAIIYDHVEIGNRVVIGPGTVIGFDGFGYVPMKDGSYKKIPQVGKVVIEDDVEIGANTTIDRATISETRIRKGAKLDNLIQIAHNVEVGENTVMAAQSGISGSTKIGRQNIIAGQVGFVGHIETTEHVIVGAQSGVSKSLIKSGTYFGSPARNHREALRLEGVIRSLPELTERVKHLEEVLAETEKR